MNILGSRYKFRIKVENAYGISEASEESDAFDVGGVQLQQDSRYCNVFSTSSCISMYK